MVISNYLGRVEVYDTTTDAWHTMPAAPFPGSPWLLTSNGNQVFVVGLQNDQPAQTPFAVLNADTGKWKRCFASVPDDLSPALESCSGLCPSPSAATGDATRLFFYAGINKHPNETAREIAFEYDIAVNRWIKLPAPPLSFRYGSAVQWTGRAAACLGWGRFSERANVRPRTPTALRTTRQRTRGDRCPRAMSPSAGAASVWDRHGDARLGRLQLRRPRSRLEVGDGAAYNPTTNS